MPALIRTWLGNINAKKTSAIRNGIIVYPAAAAGSGCLRGPNNSPSRFQSKSGNKARSGLRQGLGGVSLGGFSPVGSNARVLRHGGQHIEGKRIEKGHIADTIIFFDHGTAIKQHFNQNDQATGYTTRSASHAAAIVSAGVSLTILTDPNRSGSTKRTWPSLTFLSACMMPIRRPVSAS